MSRPCPRGCGGFLAARETKNCVACRAADRIRPCHFCGTQLGARQSRCCGAPACMAAKRQTYKGAFNASLRRRYAEDPEYRRKVLERNASWRASPEGREWIQQWHAGYYERNREHRIAASSRRAQARRAHKRATMVLPFTAAQLRQRLSMYHGCWICGTEVWDEIDHVKPIAKGGPHILANLRPACRDCNRRKSATWPIPTRCKEG